MKITAKFGNMRKAVDFTVFPRPTNVGPDYSLVTMKSDHRHIVIDTKTGKGLLSAHAANFPDVRKGNNTRVNVDQDMIDRIMKEQPKKGDSIGNGVFIIG